MGLVKKRYAVHMKADMPTIEGLLVSRSRTELVLIDVEVLQDAQRSHALSGRVRVPRENVYCLQELQ